MCAGARRPCGLDRMGRRMLEQQQRRRTQWGGRRRRRPRNLRDRVRQELQSRYGLSDERRRALLQLRVGRKHLPAGEHLPPVLRQRFDVRHGPRASVRRDQPGADCPEAVRARGQWSDLLSRRRRLHVRRRLLLHLQSVGLSSAQPVPEGMHDELHLPDEHRGGLLYVRQESRASVERLGALPRPGFRALSEGVHAIVRLHIERRAMLQRHLFEELPQAVQLGQ